MSGRHEREGGPCALGLVNGLATPLVEGVAWLI